MSIKVLIFSHLPGSQPLKSDVHVHLLKDKVTPKYLLLTLNLLHLKSIYIHVK